MVGVVGVIGVFGVVGVVGVVGVLGVVGPTRMSYEDVIPVVDITARFLGTALKSLH